MTKLNTYLAVLMVLALLLGGTVVGCGETAKPTPTKVAAAATASSGTAVPAATATPAATPTKAPPQPKLGGTLTYIQPVAATCQHFDAHTCATGNGAFLGGVYESLLTRDPLTLALLPALAESYQMSADATSLTLNLRKGVKWQNIAPVNGREFTSEDVKWNLERIRDLNPAGMTTTYLAAVGGIEIPDKYTVKIVLKQPFAPLVYWLSDQNMMMYPKELFDSYGLNQKTVAVGTGPFMVKSFEWAQALVFAKNPDYWNKGLPRVDTVRVVVITDAMARLTALRSAQGDAMGAVSATDAESLKGSVANLQVYQHMGLPVAMRMNAKAKPFDDQRVRKAMHLAIDRQQLITLAAGGSGDIVGFIRPDGAPYARPLTELAKLPGYRQPKDQDVAEAKRLLAEAGYSSGLTVECQIASGLAYYTTMAEVIKDQMAKIGVTWNIKVVEGTVLSTNILQANTYTAALISMGGGGDPDSLYNSFYTKGRLNISGWGSAEIDALLDQGRATGDEQKRIQVYRQLEDKLFENLGLLPVITINQFLVVRPGVKEMKVGPNVPVNWVVQTHKTAWIDN